MIAIFLNSFKDFAEGISNLSLFWKIWVYSLVVVNGLLPWFFLPRFTAIIVLLSSFTGLFVGLVITHVVGYDKILGLMHFPWIPMIAFQIYFVQNQEFALNSAHNFWLALSLVMSFISIIIDFKDVLQYLSNFTS